MKKIVMSFVVVASLVLITVFALGTKGPFPLWITALTGDMTLDSQGASSIGSSKVTSAMIVDSTIVTGDVLDGTLTSADQTVYTADGDHLSRIVRYTYDVAVDGGDPGTMDLGQDLPANALVTRSWYSIVTAFVAGAGSPTLAFECEDTANLKAAGNWSVAVDISATAGSNTTGAQDGTPANYTGAIAAVCNISAVVATNSYSAGKAVGYIEYTVAE